MNNHLFMGILAGVLWLLCFLLSAGQAALTRMPDALLRERADQQGVYGRMNGLLSKPNRFSDAMLFWKRLLTFSEMLVLWELLLSPALRNYATGHMQTLPPAVVILGIWVMFCLVLVLCRKWPKRLGNALYARLAPLLCDFCAVFTLLAIPFLWMINGLTALLSLPLGREGSPEDAVTEEEIRLMVDMGNETGSIEKSEKDMINNVFAFDDRTVSQVMTHRTDVTAIPEEANLQQVMEIVTDSMYSRLPVYRENVDNIIGVLYAKDLLCLVGKPEQTFVLSEYVREILYVPENMGCRDMFAQLQEKKLQIAVVVDEYGGTFGIVTMEDLLESIVGSIQDEYDNEDEEIYQLSDNNFLLKGSVAVQDVEQYFEITLDRDDEEEYDTFGGMLTHLLGGIPRTGSHPTLILSGIAFTVAMVEDRRIVYIRARRLPADAS